MTENRFKAVAISISDTRDASEDASGELLAALLAEAGMDVVGKILITDDVEDIVGTIKDCSDRGRVNLIVTTGGTGLGPRDNTPEATLNVIERNVPGLAEAMRFQSRIKTPLAMLSRGVCGVRGESLILNLPGSPKAVAECFEVIRPALGHALELIAGRGSH